MKSEDLKIKFARAKMKSARYKKSCAEHKFQAAENLSCFSSFKQEPQLRVVSVKNKYGCSLLPATNAGVVEHYAQPTRFFSTRHCPIQNSPDWSGISRLLTGI